jgi:hypothetical protein
MNTLQIQDSFQPYYAGRKDPAYTRKPAKPVKARAAGKNDRQEPRRHAESIPQQVEDKS